MNHWCAVGVSNNTPTTYPVVQYNIFDSQGYQQSSSSSYGISHYGFSQRTGRVVEYIIVNQRLDRLTMHNSLVMGKITAHHLQSFMMLI